MDSELNASRTDPIKSLSNTLREPAAEPIPVSKIESEKAFDGLQASAQPDGGKSTRPPEGSRTPSALWRFAVFCTEPVLSRLRNYFTAFVPDLTRSITTLIDLVRSSNRRAAATWHTVAALKERTETLARREDVENLATQLKALESQSVNAHRLTDALLNPMEVEPVVIIGSGGHAKVVIELIRAEGKYQIAGCTGLTGGGFVLGDVPILGDDSALPDLFSRGVKKAFVAIGDNPLRVRLLARATEMGFELINAVSPHAVISPSATLGKGIAIMAGAIINASAQIRDGAIINTNAVVDHDCYIDSGAHICPSTALAGNVKIGCETFLGTGTCVVPGVQIGNHVTIGAGSVVVRDIPDDVKAMGVPARIVSDLKT
jgi:UDP-perosamine 4-acetyltransferase